MTKQEHLLVILMEECNELAKDAAKSLRFTPESDYDGITNREKLQREFNDLLAIVEMLRSEGIFIYRDENLIRKKIEKVEHFFNDSKECGTLE